MRRFAFAVLLLLVSAQQPRAAEDLSKAPAEALIDDLTVLDASTPGIDDTGEYEAFLADDAPPQFRGGLLPTSVPTVPAAMRELVRRGVLALPALLDHLGDKRSTGILVGNEVDPLETFGGQFFGDEYDPRDLHAASASCGDNDTCRRFEHKYIVKVGDVCEVLVGQIVNRHLSAARYQPTAIVYVNSPVETPALVERIREDWAGLDARAHEASLLADLRDESELYDWHGYRDTLTRLRFYYPKTYTALSGDDLAKRNKFEADEQEERARAARDGRGH